jgi:hypothetical protein
MQKRTWMLPSYLAMVVACGSDAASSLDASDAPLGAGDLAAKDNDGGDVAAGGDSGTITYIIDALTIDSSMMDAEECRADISELSTRGWIRPCASLVDAGVPIPTCIGQSPGLKIFRATCDQRETWLWSYGGTHSQECFYDHGALVGARLGNDTPAFCGNASNILSIGATEGCPATPGTLVLNCDPFVDADWQPWAPDAL